MICKTFLTATFAAAFAFGAITAPAFANTAPATDDGNVSVAMVRTADLNLANADGQATLKARIAGAVNRVCGTSTGTITPQERLAINTCRAKARRAALAAAKSREDQVLAQR